MSESDIDAETRSNRIPSLDGLRGLAILLVVISHIPGSGFAQYGGAVGVHLFFVLSGFLITRLLISETVRTGRISLRVFWLRRAARLLPAIAILVVGFLPIAVLLGETSVWLRNSLLGAAYQASFVLSRGGTLGVVDHMWSLAVEEWFYVVWPVAVIMLVGRFRTHGLARAIGALAAAALMWKLVLNVNASYVRSYFSIDGNAFALLGGAATAAMAHRSRSLRSKRTLHIAIACIVLYGLSPNLPGEQASLLWGTVLVMPISAIAVWHAQVGSALLDLRVLRWFGRISYSLYLWHLPLLEAPILVRLGTFQRTAILLAGAILISAVSTAMVEEPIVARVKRLHAGRTSYGFVPLGGSRPVPGNQGHVQYRPMGADGEALYTEHP